MIDQIIILSGLTPHGCFWIMQSGDIFTVKFNPGLSVTCHKNIDDAIARVKSEIMVQEMIHV